MSRNSLTLFRLFGLEVRIHSSWIFLAALLLWSLSAGHFPYTYPGLSSTTYWIMGLVATIGLFASIIMHEFAHALMARSHHLPVKGINLFILGGVADLEEEPDQPMDEFWMSIVGPLMSVFLGILFFAITKWGESLNWPLPVQACLSYLYRINWILAIFNMLPGFPLDGGRVLRSLLWKWKGDIKWATHKAVLGTTIITTIMFIVAVLQFLGGFIISGIWLFIVALFLKSVGTGSERQLLVRQALEGEPLDRVINPAVPAVSPDMRLGEVISNFFYKYPSKVFAVVEKDIFLGPLTIDKIKSLPEEKRQQMKVQEIVDSSKDPTQEELIIEDDQDLYTAFKKMTRSGMEKLLVLHQGHFKGTLSLRDLTEFLAIKMDLTHADAAPSNR